jgi:hypothetical protein
MVFTTYGSVRGCCGHRHETRQSADACLADDQAGCSSQGGYSDRAVVLVGDDGYLYHDMGQMQAEDGDHWIRSAGGCGVKL